MIEMITQAELKERLNYDPETGLFYRKLATANCVRIGDVAGWLTKRGYIQISLFNKKHYAHRLAWLYVYGVMPDKDIDHIDCVKTNNSIANLRLVTMSENQQNRKKAAITSKTGVIGVSFEKYTQRYRANIQVNKKSINLGRYDTKEDAHNAYLSAKRTIHPFGTL